MQSSTTIPARSSGFNVSTSATPPATTTTWHDRRLERIHRWFTEHHATLTTFDSPSGTPIEFLRWGRPRSGMYCINYQTIGHRLFVTGDLGSAIYAVGEPAPLDFWSACEVGYFASKCIASSEGRGYRVWDPEQAEERLREYLNDRTPEQLHHFRAEGGFQAIASAFEWREWIFAHGHLVWRDAYELGDVGKNVAQECEAHLVGLKLAMAQLRGSEVRR